MPDNIASNKGGGRVFRTDSNASLSDRGPFIAEVMYNNDPVRAGRLQVYIEGFSKLDKKDPTGWRTVSYMSPFYGETPHSGTTEDVGTYPGNSNSYGMWFTPPDVGIKVLCFFVNGDPNYGYYVGCIPSVELLNMVPGIANNETTINHKNKEMNEDPRFYDLEKPKHTSVESTMHQQGLEDDAIRGPINSSAQRESPSTVYGISTPGRPVYAAGYKDNEIKKELESDTVELDDMKVIGRRGGHTFVMDDGDLEGKSQHIRIRTSKGHQITMSDDGDTFYITHANGQSWVEFGKEGTVDLYSSNSVNVRTEGSINLHAEDDINMYAGRDFNIKGKESVTIESTMKIGVKSDGTIATVSGGQTTTNAGGNYAVVAPRIDWQDAPTLSVASIPLTKFADVKYDKKWVSDPEKIDSIVTKAPTHEPYGDRSGIDVRKQFPRTAIDEEIVNIINNGKVPPPEY